MWLLLHTSINIFGFLLQVSQSSVRVNSPDGCALAKEYAGFSHPPVFRLLYFYFLGNFAATSKAMFTHYSVHVWRHLLCWQWTKYCDAMDILLRPRGNFKLPHYPVCLIVRAWKPKQARINTHMGFCNRVTFPERLLHGHLRRSCYGWVANKVHRQADGLVNDVHKEGSPDITSINENGHR